MKILDPGHIYRITEPDPRGNQQYLKFVKRGGGAIQYPKEWPGIQTQAVMRAVIDFLQVLCEATLGINGMSLADDVATTYPLWQLGAEENQHLTLHGIMDTIDVIDILADRSGYLNDVLECVETSDAIAWLYRCIWALRNPNLTDQDRFAEAIYGVRMALWNYEARAYRRKQEEVNRKQPAHDDTARLRAWRKNPADDVPFNEYDIELRPIGSDGHIVIEDK